MQDVRRSRASDRPGRTDDGLDDRSVAGDLRGHAGLRRPPRDQGVAAPPPRGHRAELRQRLLLPEPRDHGLRPRPDARRRAQSPRPARGRADDRPDGARHFWGDGTCLDISDVPPREYATGERLDRALAESAADAARPGRRAAAAHRARPTASAGRTSTRRSTPASTSRRRTGWATTRSRSSASTRRARTTRPTRSIPCTCSAGRTASRHYENLANLEAVVGRRFRFFGFPLRIRGGHGSPVRAVAMLHD